MKFLLKSFPCLVMSVLLLTQVLWAQTTLYVSTEGQPGNPGTLSEPFATLEEAQQAIRQLKQTQTLNQGARIYIRGGIYSLSETFTLTEEDAATDPNQPIVWEAYQDEKVILTGGRVLSDFEPVSDPAVVERLPTIARGQVVQADLTPIGISSPTIMKKSGFGLPVAPTSMEIFFRGEPLTRARYPNEGWLEIVNVPQSGELQYEGDVANPGASFDGIPGGRHYGRFTYTGNRPNLWKETENIWMHGYWTWDWADMYEKVDYIDTLKKEIHIAKPYHQYGYRKGQRFYFIHILEELDQPGEWYVDTKQNVLYLWPPSPIEEGDLLVSLMEQPIMLMQATQGIVFRKIIFEAARGNAVEIRGGSNNKLVGCTLRNVGNYGAWVEGGEQHEILSCDIYQTGDGGIYLAGGDRHTLTPGHHRIDNCHIHHYSRINRTGRPAVSLNGVGNTLSHSYIHDAPHMGVWFHGNEHVLEYNEIHDVAEETGDVGAFYIGRDWSCRGNVIRYNYFHHLYAPGLHGVRAVYLDDWSSGTTVYGNVFYKAGRAAFIGGGRSNTIENNLFIDCEPSVHVDARGIGWASSYFDKESPYYKNTLFDRLEAMNFEQPPFSKKYPELLNLYEDDPALPKHNRVAYNVSYGKRWMNLLDGMDFDIVAVTNNFIADSILINWVRQPGDEMKTYTTKSQEVIDLLESYDNVIYEGNPGISVKDDYYIRIEENFPPYKLGFKPIPIDTIGLYTDEYRKIE